MTLHLHASPAGNDDIERGEAVHRPHRHSGSVWEAFVSWLRDFLRGPGTGQH